MCTAVPSAKGLGVIFRMKFFVVLLAICALTSAAEFSSTEQIYDSEQVNNNVTDDEKTNKTVCYDELGCFDDSIGHRLPSDPSEIPPTYLMFSAENPEVRMSWNDTIEDLRNKTDGFFDEEAHLIFITHGFGESLDKPWLWNLKNATLKAYPDARVVIIDWGQAAFLPLYKRAASNVPVIANMTIRLTMKLMEIAPTIKAKNIYFIGFSLGAQMAGYYSREFTKQTGTKIGRITSLDAAAPLFEILGIAPRRGDADFVEAIHTSAGNNIVTGKVGYIPPYADIDFYPNGGVKQPGCSIFVIPCSHQRSIIYLTHAFDNLNECQFKGVRCATVKEANDAKCNGTMIDAYIGQKDIANYPRLDEEYHIVYMKTDSRSPFCRKD